MVFDKTYSLNERSSDHPHLVDNQEREVNQHDIDNESHTSFSLFGEGIKSDQSLTSSSSIINQLRRTTVPSQSYLEGPGSNLFHDHQQTLNVLRKCNSLNLIRGVECQDSHLKETTIIVQSVGREAAASPLTRKLEGQEIPSLNVTPKLQGNDIAGRNQIKIEIEANPRHSTPLPGKVSIERDIPEQSLHHFSSEFQDNTDSNSIQSTSRLISVKSQPDLTHYFSKDPNFLQSNQPNLFNPEKLNSSKEIKTWENCTFTQHYPSDQGKRKKSSESSMKVKTNKSIMKKKPSENPVVGYFNHGWNWPEFAAEFIGTFVLMMINNGVVLVFTLLKPVTVDTLAMGYVAGKSLIFLII